MKVNLHEIREMVDGLVTEAKKKKEKADKAEHVPDPPEYQYAEALDFSAPLGGYNLYRSQGAVNWGPMTAGGPKIDDRVHIPKSAKMTYERAVKIAAVIPESSAWSPFLKEIRLIEASRGNVWEELLHWYDFQKKGLGGRSGRQSVHEWAGSGPPPGSRGGGEKKPKEDKVDEHVGRREPPGKGPEGTHPEGDIDEKRIGFKRLKAKLAHKKGVKDPGALAAAIGRKKYGAAGMAKKAAAGRK